jgi:hypothetical protein
LVDYGIQVCTKPPGIDPRRAGSCLGKRCSEYEPPQANGSQLRNRRAVARHYDGFAGLYFAENGSGLIPKLALINDSTHGQKCSTCSTL